TIGGTILTSAGDYDIFVAKFDTAGSPLWAVRGGGSSRESALDIAVDPSGNCFLTGGYTNATSIGALSLASDGGIDGYVARLGGTIVVTPPRFVPSSLVFTPAGHFQFQLSGAPTSSILIQASGNLTQWSAISTNTFASDGTVRFEDSAASAHGQRFYRTTARQ